MIAAFLAEMESWREKLARNIALQNPNGSNRLNKTVLKRQIETTDRQIEQLVYQLYDLTKGEIEIVENSF